MEQRQDHDAAQVIFLSGTLAVYAGRYTTNDPYKTVTVAKENGRLVARIGGLTVWMTPAQPDRFGGYSDPFSGPDAMQFHRNESGAIAGFDWGDRFDWGTTRFDRVNGE